MPLTFQLLGENVRGQKILDLGCGDGGYTRELARRGATVIGLDGSERLVEVARQRAMANGLDIRFVRANASHLEEISSGAFDLVLATMSLMDVEDYEGAIAEAHRVLRHGGGLFMSISHPCFTLARWTRNDASGATFFAVDRYFDRISWEDRITSKFARPVIRRHRPLEDYMGAPLKMGFVLRDFREPSASDQDVKKSTRFWKLKRIPYFLFMRWTKP